MAAVGPIPAPVSKPDGDSRTTKLLRVTILVLMVGISAWLLFSHSEWFENPRSLKAEVLSWGPLGPLAYILLFAVGPSFLVPGAVMTIAGGLAFGAFWGAIWSLVGANLGALLAFGAGRFLGKSFVEGLFGERFRHLLDRLVRNGFYVILYLRMVPVIPYNALNMLAGASPITFRDYFWASVIGMIPGTILFAFLGDALWHPTSPRFFLAIALILCCFAGGEAYRRWKKVAIS
ncbi:MAG: TVP38/TMEM64 family protein [Candidatus Binataceae bacterium]